MTDETSPVRVEQYAIALIAEECAETTQMVGKWLRFGPDHARRDGLTARAGLSIEAGDLLAALDYGQAAGVLDPAAMQAQRSKKLARLTDPASVDDEGRRLAPPVAALAAPKPAEGEREWPDIGADPMKGPRPDDRYADAVQHVRAAYVRQQQHVPDQTALVWRKHIGALLEIAIRFDALLANRRGTPALPPRADDGWRDAYLWKWIERALFDPDISVSEALGVIAGYPTAPWNLGRWDVDHKAYAAELYKRFPKAGPPAPQEPGQ